jgi:cephalosporin hydroxylase
MKITIDEKQNLLTTDDHGKSKSIDLYSPEAFHILSKQWLRLGVNAKYSYTFSWLGRPIIQLPEDIIRLQETIYRVKPDVIVETGVAHGGSLVFSASLCKLIGGRKVIGVDIEIRPHNRQAIENHELAPFIHLIEGSSIDPHIVQTVKEEIRPSDRVLVILDSNHTKNHVFAELEAYHSLVSPDSYIIVADGVIKDLHDLPKGNSEWSWDSPYAAVEEFVKNHPEFSWETPSFPFNESSLTKTEVTYLTGGWLKRRSNPSCCLASSRLAEALV